MAFYVVEVDNDGFKVYDSAGNAIDPAKDASVTALGTILTAIKNTDGIKKIVDALPAGTNNIGDVDVLSSALPTGASTEATLLLIKTKTDNIPSDPAKESGKLTSLETILTAIKDTAGIKKIVDALPAGDSTIGRTKITDGTSVVDVLDSGGVKRLRVDAQVTPAAPDFTFPTFVATALGVVLGNGKSLLSLVNATGSTVIARLREIWLSNAQTSAVTGVAGLFEGRRITGHSGGSAVSPLSHDTADSLSGSLTAITGATVAGEAAAGLFARRISTDEWGPGTLDVEGLAQGLLTMDPVWRMVPPLKPIVLRPNEGFSFKCVTNTTAGSFDVTFIFTQETP